MAIITLKLVDATLSYSLDLIWCKSFLGQKKEPQRGSLFCIKVLITLLGCSEVLMGSRT